MAGLISEVEERISATFNNVTWEQWQKMPYLERVDGVAYHRLTQMIEMSKEDAVSREVEQRSRRSSKK